MDKRLWQQENFQCGYLRLISMWMTVFFLEGTDRICNGESKEGFITFISPEAYPHSLKVGDKISFQKGATVVGYAEVLDVINDILKA